MNMNKLFIGIAAAASLSGAAAAYAQTDGAPRLIFGVDRVGDMSGLTKAQFVYLGQQYCWYPSGWRGPGFYYCGYAWRHGYGWGGPAGWMGFTYRGGAYYSGGAIYRGGGWHYGGNYYNSGGRATLYGPNGGSAHGGYVNGRYGGSAAGGTVNGRYGGSASAGEVNGRYGGSVKGGTVTGPGGRTAGAAKVTGPGGNSRTVVRHPR